MQEACETSHIADSSNYISWLSFICDRNKASNFWSGASKSWASPGGKAWIEVRRVLRVTTESTNSWMSTFGFCLWLLSCRVLLQGVGREKRGRSSPLSEVMNTALLLLDTALISRSESAPGGGNKGFGGSGSFSPQQPHLQNRRRFRWPRLEIWAPSDAHLGGGSSSRRSRGPTRWRSEADRTWAPTKLPRAHFPKGSEVRGPRPGHAVSSTIDVSAHRGGLGDEAKSLFSSCNPSGVGVEHKPLGAWAWVPWVPWVPWPELKRILVLFSGSCALITSRILRAMNASPNFKVNWYATAMRTKITK